MYVDPITSQTYDYATPITCDKNPRNIFELDPDSDDQDFYILGPEPIKRKPPLMFTLCQINTTIRPTTFTSNDMIKDGQTLPCYFADGFCKRTTKTPFTLVWFNNDYCFLFKLKDFIGRMTKIDDRYWIETDSYVHSPHSIKPKTNSGIKGLEHPYVYAPHTQHHNIPSLSRFEVFPKAQTFCSKPDPLYSTQYSDLFVTYTDGFNMQTGQPNPHSIIDEYVSGKIVLDTSNNKFIFPALNVSNNFATIDYDAHINTKIDYTIKHVFRSMTVQERNTLHTICELDRNQLLTILAMSVQNPQLPGFLLTGN